MSRFRLNVPFEPAGDQPDAIRQLVEGGRAGVPHQVLLGATGTGKTYSIAHVIEQLGKPTLVLSHNKTLAAQLYGEFKSCFPTTLWSILSVTTTTISLKLMWSVAILTFKRTH